MGRLFYYCDNSTVEPSHFGGDMRGMVEAFTVQNGGNDDDIPDEIYKR